MAGDITNDPVQTNLASIAFAPKSLRRKLMILLASALALAAGIVIWERVHRIKPQPAETREPSDSAFIPARRSAGKDLAWLARHEQFVTRAKQGEIDLLFLGDSITDDFRTVPGALDFFNQRYGQWRPANFGIDHDRTQHLLWRILNGEIQPAMKPRVAVILIGTNNTGADSPEAIARGIEECVKAVRKQLPTTKVLLLGLFPRGRYPTTEKRAIILKVNQQIAHLDDGRNIRFLNLYDTFLQPDGELSDQVMYDHLHPSLKGYQIWVDGMQTVLDEMMRR